jgi:hypothetical protein
MSGLFYLGIKSFVPALVGLGLTTVGAGAVMAVSLLMAGALRFFFGWLDKKISNIKLPLMIIGTLGMAACIPITATFPIFSLILFTIMSAIHTPYYWAWCKEQWGKTYISTTVSLGFVAMYLGAGILYGAW